MALFISPTALDAINKLQKKREVEGKKPALGLRVGIRGGGCTGFGYLFEWCDESPRATDKVFEFAADATLLNPDGKPTTPATDVVSDRVRVFCDPKSLIYLDGTTLDYVTSVMGHGFKFVNPNVKGTCGCGESVQF
jgi:iron-sulfur cluster assembly protein